MFEPDEAKSRLAPYLKVVSVPSTERRLRAGDLSVRGLSQATRTDKDKAAPKTDSRGAPSRSK